MIRTTQSARYRVTMTKYDVVLAAVDLAIATIRNGGSPKETTLFITIAARANVLARIALDECNGIPAENPSYRGEMVWGDKEQAVADAECASAEAIIKTSASIVLPGWDVEFNRDPRGCPVKFIKDGVEITVDAGE